MPAVSPDQTFASGLTPEGAPLRTGGLAPGALVAGNYQVRGKLGEGAMGVVFEAQDLAINRRVALKIASSPEGDAGLRLEAQALAAVASPLVPAVYSLLTHEGVPVLVMERIYGTTLADLLHERRANRERLTIDEVLDILGVLADGLLAVHRAGVAHRDVKPDNIILSPGNRAVLLDFGVMLPAVQMTGAQIAGTPQYMAPEQFTGTLEPTEFHLLDVYALGAVAWEMLVGRPPFDGTVEQVIHAQVTQPAPELRLARPEVPIKLAALVGAMLAKDPSERPAAMDIIAWQLRSVRAASARQDEAGFGILVVDDDPDVLDLLQLFVREAAPQCEVRVAKDGEEALRLVRERPPNLMFLDLNLPKMTGVQLCLALRSTHLADACVIVPISGSATDEDHRLLRGLGLTRFVAKNMAAHDRIVELVADEIRRWAQAQRQLKKT